MAKRPYNARLAPDDQIQAEERIAAFLFDEYPEGFGEEDAGDAGRAILYMVLSQFRPDLLSTKDWKPEK